MRKQAFFALLILATLLTASIPLSSTAQSAVPMLINYEGELRSPGTGDPVPDGEYDMRFRIYTVETGGTHIWEQNYAATHGNAVEVTDGVFSVLLGSGTGDALSDAVFNGPDRWLEIMVESETMTPRQRITSSAYSIIAENAHLLSGREASEFADASHAHSGTDITTGIISEGRIHSSLARDTEVDSKITTHAAITDAHHGKTTTFAELTGTATDAQIPAAIARDSEIMPTVLGNDGTGSTLDADRLDGKDSADFAASSHNHSGADITSGTVADGRIAASLARDTEVDSKITTHAGVSDAHHTKTTTFGELTGTATDAQIPAAIARDSEVTSGIATHAGIADAHHARYTDVEAVSAMGAKSDTNPLHHDKTTSFSGLTGTATDAQIPNNITINYAASAGDADTVDGAHAAALEESAEIDADIGVHAGISDAHHTRYTNSEAVAAMGAKANTNPLNHDKTTAFGELTGTATDAQIPAAIARDTEVDSKITAHTAIASAHHAKTTTFTELTGTAADAQIPASIARDSEVTSQISTHTAIADAHHTRYTNSEAVSAMGNKSNTNPLNHDKTTSFSELTGTLSDGQIPASIARDSEIMPTVLAGDGPGSTLNADLLDGISSSGFAAAAHTHTGDFWGTGGNSGTTPGTHFLGTSDNKALELRVNSARALRVEPQSISPNLVGGYSGNSVTPGAAGATIGGGGDSSGLNRVTDDYGTIGGGAGNQAGNDAGTTLDANYATVSGGAWNIAGGWSAMVGGGQGNVASGLEATVGGGDANTASGKRATIGGGTENQVMGAMGTIGGGAFGTASHTASTVAGGYLNTAAAEFATIAGGAPSDMSNSETANATKNRVTDMYGTIGGGGNNQAGDATGTTEDAEYATVSGGQGNIASGYWATVGGGWGNKAGDYAATVAGGMGNTVSELEGTVGGGRLNSASGAWATVNGGATNKAGDSFAVVGGGSGNKAIGGDAVIAGGYLNTASGVGAAVAGGYRNEATGERSSVGGGEENYAHATYATIGGGGPIDPGLVGTNNLVASDYGTVGGGGDNWAGDIPMFSQPFATVGGGAHNRATGSCSTVPGGKSNTAAGYGSLAAGLGAAANHNGTFVWADSSGGVFASPRDNCFRVRALGGAAFITTDGAWVEIWGNQGSLIRTSCGAGLTWGGTWYNGSDRDFKENFGHLDTLDVLDRVLKLPINTWNYKVEGADIQHIGPVSQDFHDAFGLGQDDKTIGTVDADGVAFAAIQGLHKLVQEKDAKISSLEEQNAALNDRLSALESLVESLAQRGDGE